MIRIHAPAMARAARGMSLIELMVALLISSIVVLGLVTLVNAIGIANRTQDGLARLQENGRFAVQRIAADVRAAATQHCSNFDAASSFIQRALVGGAFTGPITGSVYVEPARSPSVSFDAFLNPSIRTGPSGQTAPYLLSNRFFLQGHECDAANCTPAVTAVDRGVNRLIALPAMGSAATQRAAGADVLTVRYLTGDGARVIDFVRPSPGLPAGEYQLELADLAPSGFAGMADGDPVWVSDCSVSSVFRGRIIGNVLSIGGGNFAGFSRLAAVDEGTDVRAFHVPTALRTVSYYLRIKQDTRQPGRRVSALVRTDGTAQQELVEGVERLDFLYGVEDAGGRVSYLTAAQVDAIGGVGSAAGVCPPYAEGVGGVGVNTNEPGCAWRAVKSIEVYLLVNTVDDVSPQGDDEFRYSWLNNGAPNNAGTFENPQSIGVLRNGLPAGRMLRREFRALISLRGYNY